MNIENNQRPTTKKQASNPMNKVIAAALLASLASTAGAGEFRGVLGTHTGEGTSEYATGDEVSGDGTSVFLSVKRYAGEAGPFIGITLAQDEVSSLEVNGLSVGAPDVESTDISATIGYRAGQYGAHQPVLSATFGRSDSGDGDESDAASISVGLEKSGKEGRYELDATYTAEEDLDILGVDIVGTLYVNKSFGFSVGAGYSIGDGNDSGVEVDYTGWHVGVGIEYRTMN